MTREEAEALTNLIHELRPEWDRGGIFKALGLVKDRNPFDVSMAALRAAADPETRTPGRIPTAGDHWHERISPTVAPRPPKPSEACRTCGRHMHAADAICDTPTARLTPKSPPPVTYLEARRGINRPTEELP